MSHLPAARRPLTAFVRVISAFVVFVVLPAQAQARGSVVEDWHGPTANAWQVDPTLDFRGWASTSSDAGYDFTKIDEGGRSGLAVTALFNPHAPLGLGEWRWQAPGTSTIYRADYGAASFNNKEGCINEGLRLSSGDWQSTVNYREGGAPGAGSAHPTACGANATVTGAPVTTKDGTTAVTITGAPGRQTFCSDPAGCGLENSPIANSAVFGVQRIKQGRPGFEAYLPGAKLSLTDYDVPLIQSAANSHPRWVRSARGTVTVVASDTGLGVKKARVSHATLAGPPTTDAQTQPCAGDRNDRCPAVWNTDRPEWTTNWPYDTDEMPEGVQSYGLVLEDIVDNRTPASGDDTTSVPVSKIDRSVPDPITGTGQIPGLDGRWFLGNDTRTIDVVAHDTYSGVQTVQIETTDGTVLDTATFDCGGDQCPRDITKTLSVDTTRLPEGDTVVRIRATDLVGNTATGRTWTLRIDRSDPTDVAGTGNLPSIDGIWTRGNDTRTVEGAAHDRYSGVKSLALETADGQTIDRTTFTCDQGQCSNDESATLSLDLRSLPEGDTRVRLRATDLLDHTSVGPTWTLRVDRGAPDEVFASGAVTELRDGYLPAGAALGVRGAAHDRWSGVARLDVLVDGQSLAAWDAGCPVTGCATSGSHDFLVDVSAIGEGEHSAAVRTTDLVAFDATSTSQRFIIDRTAPGGFGPLVVGYDDGAVEALWQAATDPPLPGGVAGAGFERFEVRWRNGGDWTGWSVTADGGAELEGVTSGSHVQAQIRAVDRAGNASSALEASVTADDAQPTESPVLTMDAARAYAAEYGGSLEAATAWIQTSDAASDLDLTIDAADPSSGLDVVWFDNASRRVKIGVTAGAHRSVIDQQIANHGLQGVADVVTMPATTSQLMSAESVLSTELADLIDAGRVRIGRIPAVGVDVEITASASAGEESRVRDEVGQRGVPARVRRVASTSFTGVPTNCTRNQYAIPGGTTYFTDCDAPLRGGSHILGTVQMCSFAFTARSSQGNPFIVTAGHCDPGADGSWTLPGSNGSSRTAIGPTRRAIFGSSGDYASVAVTNDDLQQLEPWVYVPRSSSGSTERDPRYTIDGFRKSKVGRYLCFDGSRTGTHCGEVEKLDVEADYPSKTVGGLGMIDLCNVRPGDSGGAVIKGHRAYGIISGTGGSAADDNCEAYYQGISVALDELNLNLVVDR